MIDLHLHSTFSDGSLTPEELVASGEELGLTAIALTDHDSTGGVERFLAASDGKSVRTIGGVEISAEFSPGTMHILGYYVDRASRQLNDHLKWIREGREARNQEILHKLVALGCHITWEQVAAFAGDDVVGRPHFAQALVAGGYVSSTRQAFDRYLARGKPAYADRRRLTPEDSIEIIQAAGGLAVLAHPFTLGLKGWDLRKLVKNLSDQGLAGIEAYYTEHTPAVQREYMKLAKEYDLVVTGGTDFHGVTTPDIKMGRGFGSMNVPDSVVTDLEQRRARNHGV